MGELAVINIVLPKASSVRAEMLQRWKGRLKPLPGFREYVEARDRRFIIQRWEDEGKPIPPPHVAKQRIVKRYGKQFQTKILIETGTFKGDMIFAVRKSFQHIYSIELGTDLYQRAKERFARFPHIKIVHGDSSVVLGQILDTLDRPALFWLDGHYSEGITARGDVETPIRRELELIFAHPIKDHVILIDDAREFTGERDYPTIGELQSLVSNQQPGWSFVVEDDVIRIHRRI